MQNQKTSNRIVIRTKEHYYTLTATVHELHDQSQFNLHPVQFYMEHGKTIPTPPHHEIEVAEPYKSFFSLRKFHIQYSDDQSRVFVCYPLKIESIWKAFGLFRIWSLGVVLKLENNIDITEVLDERCGGNSSKAYKLLEKEFGIVAELEEREV